MILLLIVLMMLTCNVNAEIVAKDSDTVTVITRTDVSVSSLNDRLQELKKEKAKWDDVYDPLIKEIQSQIDEAAQAGVEHAISLASPDIQESIKLIVPEKNDNVNWSSNNINSGE